MLYVVSDVIFLSHPVCFISPLVNVIKQMCVCLYVSFCVLIFLNIKYVWMCFYRIYSKYSIRNEIIPSLLPFCSINLKMCLFDCWYAHVIMKTTFIHYELKSTNYCIVMRMMRKMMVIIMNWQDTILFSCFFYFFFVFFLQ